MTLAVLARPAEGDRPAEQAPNLAPPPGNPRFPLFDSLRAIAALSVFAGHTVTETVSFTAHPQLFAWAAQIADAGVAIFFLISGFLLYRPFLTARRRGQNLRLGDYARRRVLRIVPAYWVALTIFLALGFVHGITTSNWWLFYGFGQNYRASTLGHGIGVAWTLCIEVTFYAVLPLFALLAARLGRALGPAGGAQTRLRGDVLLLIAGAAGALLFRAHFSNFLRVHVISTLPGTFFWFALGMGLALASVATDGAAVRTRLHAGGAARAYWPLASWAAAACAFLVLHEVASHGAGLGVPATNVTVHVLYGVTALFILLPAVFGEQEGGVVRGVLSVPALAWVGLISYAFYLYHTIVLGQLASAFGGLTLGLRYVVVTAIALPVSLACAAASYYVLERPIMRLGRRRATR